MIEPAVLRCLIIDMDGVLWRGKRPLPGLVQFFQALREGEFRFTLATNNSSLTPDQYVDKLAGMGVSVARDEVLTSAMAAAMHLSDVAPHGGPVFAIGEAGVRQALEEAGFTPSEGMADVVVVGMDRGLTWDKLAQATLNIRAGARFVGTNGDTTLPTERGITHGNGAILAALTAATGVTPTIVGKPEPLMYRLALKAMDADLAVTAAVGDRLETDILGAHRAGIHSVLLLTGVSSASDLERCDAPPTWAYEGLPELTQALKRRPRG